MPWPIRARSASALYRQQTSKMPFGVLRMHYKAQTAAHLAIFRRVKVNLKPPEHSPIATLRHATSKLLLALCRLPLCMCAARAL